MLSPWYSQYIHVLFTLKITKLLLSYPPGVRMHATYTEEIPMPHSMLPSSRHRAGGTLDPLLVTVRCFVN